MLLSSIQPRHPIYYPHSEQELENLRLLHRKMLRPQMLALHAMIPGISHMSPSRSVMSVQQASQHLVWGMMEMPDVLTGVEYEFGKHAFRDEMPEDGQIIAVVPRYPLTSDPRSIRKNPEITVIYQTKDQTIDYFSIKSWEKYHPQFGYMKRINEKNISLLTDNQNIRKGTVFAESPGVAPDGCYMLGINAMVAYLDDESLAEDGMVFKQSFVDEKLTVDIFDEIEVGLGGRDFGINMCGDDKVHDMFPEIGDFIRHDGAVMVKRRYNAMNSVVTMSAEALRTPDIADEFIYSRPTPLKKGDDPKKKLPGEIVDIIVIRNPKAKRSLPPTMAKQLERYELAYQTYLNNLIRVEEKLIANIRRRSPDAVLKTTPRFQILLKMARGITNQAASRLQGPTEFQSHRARMDEWTIRFVIRHRRTAVHGDKFAGLYGDKGVNVCTRPDADFPPGVDAMVAAGSTIGRTNLNRKFIPRIATAAWDLTIDLKKEFKITGKVSRDYLESFDEGVFDTCWKRLLLFYAITSPHLYYTYSTLVQDKARRCEHLMYCLNGVIHPLIPCDNPVNDVDMIIQLEHEGFLKPYKKITYRNSSGELEETKTPIPVLRTYLEYLEKIAEDGSASSFGKLQHHGLLASRTNQERYHFNFRNVSTRNIGQHESEILNHDSRSPALIAELMDRSNNPEVMMHQAVTLLTHETPTNIDCLVPRNQFPYGEMRPRQFLRHFFESQGMTLRYMSEKEGELLPNYEEMKRQQIIEEEKAKKNA